MRQQVKMDEAVAAVLGDGERRQRVRQMRPTARRKYRADRARSKATYDLPEDLVAEVRAIAGEEDCSASSIVAFLLTQGVRAYRRGEVSFDGYYRPSRSPRFLWVLEMPEEGGE